MSGKRRTFEVGLQMAFLAMVLQLVFAIAHSVQAAGSTQTEPSSDLLTALSYICTGDQIETRDASGSNMPKRDCPACLFSAAHFAPPSQSDSWVVQNTFFHADHNHPQSFVQHTGNKTCHQRAPPSLT